MEEEEAVVDEQKGEIAEKGREGVLLKEEEEDEKE